MYAVIETGGKQYRVSPGQTVEVELLPSAPGETVTLERVLLVSADGRTLVGRPTVAGAQVIGTVAREGRGKKVIVFRYKSKKRYRRKTGHRQDYTYLTITDIQAEGKSLVPDDKRKHYERLATASAERYEARLAGAIDQLALDEAVGDEDAVERDEEAIESADVEAQQPTDTEAQTPEAGNATDTGDEDDADNEGTSGTSGKSRKQK
jgi:large subunit ribosomal protein L21